MQSRDELQKSIVKHIVYSLDDVSYYAGEMINKNLGMLSEEVLLEMINDYYPELKETNDNDDTWASSYSPAQQSSMADCITCSFTALCSASCIHWSS